MKRAFTLAETLITLAVIGIVAAITIPVLNNTIGEKDKIAKIKKMQSTLDNMLVQAEIVHGPMETWPMNADISNMKTQYWPKYIAPFFSSPRLCANMQECGYPSNFNSKKWQDASWGLVTSSSRLLFQLLDGTVIFWPLYTSDSAGNPAYVNKIYVDINGPKNPNKYCEDVFTFEKNYDKNSISATGCTLQYITNK